MAQQQVIAGRAGPLSVVERIRRTPPALAWLIFVTGLLGFGPFSNYAVSGWLDPWIPTGYFLNFWDLVERFGFTYYITRLPYTLVGVAFYDVFTPHVANFLLNVFYLWLAATSLYLATRRLFGFGPALLATIGFATNTYTLSSMLWDYSDGASIAYLLLGTWLALDPPSRLGRSWRWVATGFAWGMAGAANLISGLVILPLCLLVVFDVFGSLREAARRTVLLIIGVASMLLVFGVASYAIFGNAWFLGPQISQFLLSVGTPGALSNMWGSGNKWILRSFRLAGILAVAASGLAALLLARRGSTGALAARAVIAVLLATVGLFCFVEFGMNAVVLRVSYTSSYLVAPTFLALAGILHLLLERDRRWLWVVVPALAVLAVLPFVQPMLERITTIYPRPTWWLAMVPALAVVAVALAGARFRPAVIRLAAALVAIGPVATITSDGFLPYFRNQNSGIYDAALKVSDVLRSGAVDGRIIRFWYDEGEKYSNQFHSTASLYLWGWRDLTKLLPTWTPTDMRAALPPPLTIVHLTSEPAKIRQREAIMTAKGMVFEPARALIIRGKGGITFTMALQDIVSMPPVP